MYDSAYARTHQLYRQSRGSLVLIKHEKDALLGKFNYQAINELFEEFGQLLTLEPNRFTKSDLLSKIIRLGLIFPNPSITLASYIDHVAENLDTIIAQHTEAEQLLCSFVALYHQNSDIDHRYKLLQRAEAFTKDSGKESERAFIKINKALIALDVQDYNTALKALNEAEHLVFRSSWKQALGRNAWIQICEWRSLIFTIMTLRGEEHYTTLLFNDLEKVVNDSSMHRHDSAIISLELNALRYFIDNRRDQALENFEKANNYRCDAIDHPRYLLNSYFIQLLKGASKKGKTTDFKEALINSKAPFYRSACSDLIDLCEKHFKSNKEAILKDE
jgi:tetratricopeptide (TPR) repeat protein